MYLMCNAYMNSVHGKAQHHTIKVSLPPSLPLSLSNYTLLNMGSQVLNIICTVGDYDVEMAESPSIATVVSAMIRCDLVSILFGDLT